MELLAMGVFSMHINMKSHRGYATLKFMEDMCAKKEQWTEAERKRAKNVGVRLSVGGYGRGGWRLSRPLVGRVCATVWYADIAVR